MLRAKSPAIVDTALSVLETALVWCRAADTSDVGLARTGLFELLVQVQTDDWERPARMLQALHMSQVGYLNCGPHKQTRRISGPWNLYISSCVVSLLAARCRHTATPLRRWSS